MEQASERAKRLLTDKTVLIFGGTGSLGRALIGRLAATNRVHVFSRDESKHWTLRNELPPEWDVKFHVGDVRDYGRVLQVVDEVNPWAVVSAAALKHVDVCESTPTESLETNVRGPQNIASACVAKMRRGGNIHVVLQVSTDKACEPVNVYGMCKALAERVFTSQPLVNTVMPKHGTPGIDGFPRFVVVRYGNVLESRCSILPLFRWQAENRHAFTVTDPNMTRFVMTLDDSVDLICAAIASGVHGQTWIPRIPAMRIGDLAELFSERFGKPIERIAVRPGEKLHEDLIGRTEAVRTLGNCEYWPDPQTWGIGHYIINPPDRPLPESYERPDMAHLRVKGYTSNDDVMTKEGLAEHLQKLGVMSVDLASFKGNSIEEIRTT